MHVLIYKTNYIQFCAHQPRQQKKLSFGGGICTYIIVPPLSPSQGYAGSSNIHNFCSSHSLLDPGTIAQFLKQYHWEIVSGHSSTHIKVLPSKQPCQGDMNRPCLHTLHPLYSSEPGSHTPTSEPCSNYSTPPNRSPPSFKVRKPRL